MAAHHSWSIRQMGVMTTFLNEELQKKNSLLATTQITQISDSKQRNSSL